MNRRIKAHATKFFPAVVLALFLQGCGDDNGITTIEGSSTATLSFTGLQPLQGGLNYQAWLVSQSNSALYGLPLVIFNVNEEGQMVDPVADTVLSGPYTANIPTASVHGVAVSLELSDVMVAYSSYSFILGGQLVQGTAQMTADDWIALNQDFSTVSGEFVLSTPTDQDGDNELSGVWFMDPSVPPGSEGLILPEAPIGWTWEGWVEVDGRPLSTGKFVWSIQADSAAQFSGTETAPPFPGEDFLFNAPEGFDFPLDLEGALVYVTVEPWNEWDVELGVPFFLRILEGQVPADPAPLTLYSMTSVVSQLPTGTATVQDGS